MNLIVIPYENLKSLNRSFEEKFKQKFLDLLEVGWYVLGEEVSHFEREFGSFHDEKYVV